MNPILIKSFLITVGVALLLSGSFLFYFKTDLNAAQEILASNESSKSEPSGRIYSESKKYANLEDKPAPQGFVAKVQSVNSKAVECLGSQFRVNLAIGSVIFLLICAIAASGFAVYLLKFRHVQELLPVVEVKPAVVDTPEPEFDFFVAFRSSSGPTVVFWVLAALFFVFCAACHFAESTRRFACVPELESFLGLLTCVSALLTILAFLTGVGLLGVSANLSPMFFFHPPTSTWLEAGLFFWILFMINRVSPVALRVHPGTPVDTCTGMLKSITMGIMFGALGSVGGLYPTIGAGILSVFIILTLVGFKAHGLPVSRTIAIAFILLILVALLSVYFSVWNGALAFIVTVLAAFFCFGFGYMVELNNFVGNKPRNATVGDITVVAQ